MAEDLLKPSLVAILGRNSEIVGCGFLVSPGHVLTCAHVVDQAVERASEKDNEVLLRFAFPGGKPIRAYVVARRPGPRISGSAYPPQDGLDFALLKLQEGDLPLDHRPAQLVVLRDVWDKKFKAFGFPEGRAAGVWVEGVLRDQQTTGWLQLDGAVGSSYFIKPGFSGSPVWSQESRGVAGMIVAADRETSIRAAFMIPTAMLLDALPDLADLDLRPLVSQRPSCLIIKPRVDAATDERIQEEAIAVIRGAIEAAGFCLTDDHEDGLELTDLSPSLIQEVDRADLVIVDVNSYDHTASKGAGLACLYYFLAMLHAQNRKVLLVTRSKEHLPLQLQDPSAALEYPRDFVSTKRFFERFKRSAEKLFQGEKDDETNPIQRYRKEMARKEQERRIQAKDAANAVQQALIAELQREIQRLSQHGSGPGDGVPDQTDSKPAEDLLGLRQPVDRSGPSRPTVFRPRASGKKSP